MNILYIADLTSDLYDETHAVHNLLKPDLTILSDEFSGLQFEYLTPYTALKYKRMWITNQLPLGMYGSIGSKKIIDHCQKNDISVCLSYGHTDACSSFNKWFIKIKNCIYFHPGQDDYSLAFIFFKVDNNFCVIDSYHPHSYWKHYKEYARGVHII